MAGRGLKPIVFLGDALDLVRAFPEAARKEAGVQLHKVQLGLPPSDWKPMPTVGLGAVEIRIHDKAAPFGCFSSPIAMTPCTSCTRSGRRPSAPRSTTWPLLRNG